MFSFPYVNTQTWADILFEKLTGGEFEKHSLHYLGRYFVANLSYFMGELTPQLLYQNYLCISASFGVKSVL